MAHTFDETIISDLYKDAAGFRPGESFWARWSAADDDGKQAIWDSVVTDQEAELERDVQRKLEAVADFEGEIAHALEVGAPDRATAIRWIADADESVKEAFKGWGFTEAFDLFLYHNDLHGGDLKDEIKEALCGEF